MSDRHCTQEYRLHPRFWVPSFFGCCLCLVALGSLAAAASGRSSRQTSLASFPWRTDPAGSWNRNRTRSRFSSNSSRASGHLGIRGGAGSVEPESAQATPETKRAPRRAPYPFETQSWRNWAQLIRISAAILARVASPVPTSWAVFLMSVAAARYARSGESFGRPERLAAPGALRAHWRCRR